jgi:hypothetical protein
LESEIKEGFFKNYKFAEPTKKKPSKALPLKHRFKLAVKEKFAKEQ